MLYPSVVFVAVWGLSHSARRSVAAARAAASGGGGCRKRRRRLSGLNKLALGINFDINKEPPMISCFFASDIISFWAQHCPKGGAAFKNWGDHLHA